MSTDRPNLRRRDRKVYRLARHFLAKTEGVTPEMIEEHLSVPECARPTSLSGVFRHLVFTAQNYQSLPKVIGCQLGSDDVGELSELLCGFDPAAVRDKYGDDWEQLLDDIDESFFPGRPRRREPKSLWPRFCRALLSGAAFLTKFRAPDHLYAWVERHDHSVRSRYLLACRLKEEIHGYGVALACDFIKELGFANWSKPDVHLKRIFVGLSLAASQDNWTVFRAIDRFARHLGVSPYHADKVFWLISSGRFYHSGVEIRRRRDRFIRWALKRLDG